MPHIVHATQALPSMMTLTTRTMRRCIQRRQRPDSMLRGLHSAASTAGKAPQQPLTEHDIEELVSNPTWSVSSLLPSSQDSQDVPEVSTKQLHHLLRLSALPPPKDQAQESQMLRTLSAQLHFVKEIQKVDTTGVEPLQSLRDETRSGTKEAELGLDALKDALSQEVIVGKHHKRIRRQTHTSISGEKQEWNVLGAAEKKVGRYFVVEGSKG